ncbi:MAG: hypothetical protein Q9183_003367 [Haloplaca sp. 2 TL-2023]
MTLAGSGGVGKTEIALEFVRRHKTDFDAIFWVQASSRQKLDEAFNSILMHLYPRTADRNQHQNQPDRMMSYSISRELLKIWLSNPYKPPSAEDYDINFSEHPNIRAKWLLIFDGVTHLEDLFEFIPRGNGAVLVTSRDSRVEMFGELGMKGLTVPNLSNDASTSDGAIFLQKLTPMEDAADSRTLRRLARKLDGWPLALRLTAALASSGCPLLEVWQRYSNPSAHGLFMDAHVAMSSHPREIALRWVLTALSHDARRILQLLTFFDTSEIVQPMFLNNKALKIGLKTRGGYQRARDELKNACLIEDGQEPSSLQMPKPVRDAVRSTLTRKGITVLFRTVLSMIWSRWPFSLPTTSYRQVSVIPRWSCQGRRVRRSGGKILYPHIRQLKDFWQQCVEVRDWTTATDHMRLAALLNDAAWYRHEAGRNQDFDGFFVLAQEIASKVDHQDKDFLLSDIHLHLGAVAASNNHHSDSQKHRNTSHQLQLSQSKGSHERLALSYSERAISHIQDGEFKEGIEALESEQRIRCVLGISRPLSSDANLSLAYMLQGRLRESEDTLKFGLQRLENTKSDAGEVEKFVNAKHLHAFGNLCELRGQPDASHWHHREAFCQYLGVFDEWDHRVADINHKLAEHLLRYQKLEDAYSTIHAALKAYGLDVQAYKASLARSLFLKSRIELAMSCTFDPPQDTPMTGTPEEEILFGATNEFDSDATWSTHDELLPEDEVFDAWTVQAADTAVRACRLRSEYLREEAARAGKPDPSRTAVKMDWELQQEDFDVLVGFWSR